MKIGKYDIDISNADKVLFPEKGYTKRDLVRYYRDIADYMLPFVKGRPVSMHRFSNGMSSDGFYHKELPDYFPGWMGTVEVQTSDGTQRQVACRKAADLVYLANQAVITPHTWLSTSDNLSMPDRMIFDLDPDITERTHKKRVVDAARIIRELSKKINLHAYVMLTGSKGIHVVIPIRRELDFEGVKKFARRFARVVVDVDPEAFTLEQRKNKRKGRIFIDVLRNAYGQTAVPPFAVRARSQAPVAVPISWDELTPSFDSAKYNIKTIQSRLSRKKDPWEDIGRQKGSLKSAGKKLDRLLEGEQ